MRFRDRPRLFGILIITSLMTTGGLMLDVLTHPTYAAGSSRATSFKLANGLEVVVIPDHRASVVTHMIWYKVGSADEPPGISGIAHFLEHLMFKSTEKIPMGEFSKIVSRLGGQDNAFTSYDATAYHQRISKDRLEKVMEMEADRMVNLRLTEKEVLTERDVILEERRSRVENNPAAILDEQMDAALYYSHHYGIPVIGWAHEMARLSPADALSFYKRHYAPNNAILIVSGDVTETEARRLAEATYGKIPANPALGGPRVRPGDPPHRAARRLRLEDERAGKASLHRYYIAPSYTTAAPGEAEALDVLMKIVGDGSTSRLYKKLVMEEKLASSASGWYASYGMDSGKIGFIAVVADGATLEAIEKSLDAVIEDVRRNGITDAELQRAKNAIVADYVYDSDNQSSMARRYGWGMTVGRSIAEIEGWPEAIANVTLDDVRRATKHFDIRASVTGTLVPPPSPAQVETVPATPKNPT